MVFSSVIFLFCFLPITLALYFVMPRCFRNAFLLLASLVFYAWGETFFVFVMLASVAGNYLFGLWLDACKGKRGAKPVLVLAIVLNLGLLFVYKYANFAVDNVNVFLLAMGLPVIRLGPVHLPIGISFFTFQALSYVIDAYRGRVTADRKFINVALYIALFPQLIAGPIVRYKDIAAQILERTVNAGDFIYGIRRFLIGLGKKVIVANTIGYMVDQIHGIPHGQMPAAVAWLGGVYYMLQVYFDFSGYSDMAIGLARMFGFRIFENFNYPYASKTLTEFWQRWHISLSTWFRDYLFTPMGSYRQGRLRAYRNLMVVFVLCGIWHGATWNFVLFGMAQGAVMALERIARAKRRRFFQGIWGHIYLLLVIQLTFVLFRSVTLSDSWWFYRSMFGLIPGSTGEYHLGMYINKEVILLSIFGVVASMPVIPWLKKRFQAGLAASSAPEARLFWTEVAGAVLFVGILLLSAIKLASDTHNPFIYFRF